MLTFGYSGSNFLKKALLQYHLKTPFPHLYVLFFRYWFQSSRLELIKLENIFVLQYMPEIARFIKNYIVHLACLVQPGSMLCNHSRKIVNCYCCKYVDRFCAEIK